MEFLISIFRIEDYEMLLTVRELSKQLGVSSKTVYAMVERDQIPHYRIGTGRGTLRFDYEAVKKALGFASRLREERLTKTKSRHLL